jgi:hypothetical protein
MGSVPPLNRPERLSRGVFRLSPFLMKLVALLHSVPLSCCAGTAARTWWRPALLRGNITLPGRNPGSRTLRDASNLIGQV